MRHCEMFCMAVFGILKDCEYAGRAVCMGVRMHVFEGMLTSTHIHANLYSIYVYANTYAFVCIDADMITYLHTHIPIIHMPLYMHTYTCGCIRNLYIQMGIHT